MGKKANIAHTHLEKPAMYGLLGNVGGLRILCLGCGSGEECDFIKKSGASKVVGIDITKGLIEQAKHKFPDVEFYTMDMEQLNFNPESFDVVYASLSIHYVSDWVNVFRQVRQILVPGGRFIFSTHHPLLWGAARMKDKNFSSEIIGFKRNDKTDEVEVYGDYLNPRKIKDTWFKDLKVAYYHKPLSQIIGEIRESNFDLVRFLEPKAIESSKKIKKDFYEIHQKIPLFMIFELNKKRI